MTRGWRPEEKRKQLRTQIAFNPGRIYFRFREDQPNRGG